MKRKTTYKSEKDFQTDYLRNLRDEWYRVYKLPDVWFELKPFDAVAIKDWVSHWIELKYWKVDTYEKIYNMLRPNQIWWLYNFQQHGWHSRIIWRDNWQNKIYKYKYEKINNVKKREL